MTPTRAWSVYDQHGQYTGTFPHPTFATLWKETLSEIMGKDFFIAETCLTPCCGDKPPIELPKIAETAPTQTDS